MFLKGGNEFHTDFADGTDYLSSIRVGAVGEKQKGDSPNDGAAPFIIDVSGKNYFFVMTTLLLPSYVR